MTKQPKTYTQCKLTKGNLYQIAYIPTELAILGNILKLKNKNNEWDNGWHVEHIYQTELSDYVLEHERDYTKQRKSSDI